MKSTAKIDSRDFIIAELSPGKIDDHVEWQQETITPGCWLGPVASTIAGDGLSTAVTADG